jgi:uncharacterized membrane protein (UPF0182 family)
MTLNMPGAASPEFSLTTQFTPRSRANTAAFMAVNSNPTSPGYGHIQILQLPQNTAIPGPQQIQSNFEGFAPASEQLKLLRGGGSKVTLGNLVTVPLGGSLLSVEPVYVSADAKTNPASYPQLQKVFTFYYYGPGGIGRGFADTLAESLAQAFQNAGQPPTTGAPGGPPGGQVNAQVLQFLQQANKFYEQAQAELKAGRLDLYYRDILKMKIALDQARNAAKSAKTGHGGSVTPIPSPSPTGSASASPSP